jgi:hypothetical protein
VKLTWDFVIVDFAAVLIILSILIGKMRAWLAGIGGSFFVALGALGILGSALLMFAHLANWRWADAVIPNSRWARFVQSWPILVTILWAAELWVAHQS